MQIRVANRQDEPAIRAIVNEARAEHGEPEINLTGDDADLNNIEAHYFWYDGVFLVAENEGKIVGIIGARRGSSEETLELLRLAVSSGERRKGIARTMLDTVLFFATNADYQRIIMHPVRQHLEPGKPIKPFEVAKDSPALWSAQVSS